MREGTVGRLQLTVDDSDNVRRFDAESDTVARDSSDDHNYVPPMTRRSPTLRLRTNMFPRSLPTSVRPVLAGRKFISDARESFYRPR